MDTAPLIDEESIDLEGRTSTRTNDRVSLLLLTSPERKRSQNYERPSNIHEACSFLKALQYDAPEVVHFLLTMGILSPWELKPFIKSSVLFGFYSMMFFVLRLIIPYFCIASLFYFAIIHESLGVFIEFGVLIDSLLFLQVLVLLPFLYSVTKDLHVRRESVRLLHMEASAYKSLMPICYVFFSVFLIMIAFDFILKFRLSSLNWFRMNLLEYFSICAITAALLFISSDCRTCTALVESLCLKATDNSLTMKELRHTRHEIDARVNRHSSTICWIVLVAVLNILYLLIFDIIITHWTTESLLSLLPWKMASYAKEIVFLMILFNESATLNEEANKLAQIIANDSAIQGEDDDNEDESSEEGGRETRPSDMDAAFRNHTGAVRKPSEDVILKARIQRLLLLGALTTKPISFPIAGRRWTKMDMLLQLVTIVVTTLIVVIRAIIMGQSL